MRKPLVFTLIFFMLVISACSASPFRIKLTAGDSVKLLKKGADFRLYEHERGFVLIKTVVSTKDALTLQNEMTKSEQANLQALFDIRLRADDYLKLGFDNKKSNLGNIVRLLSVIAMFRVISEITGSRIRYRELVIFCSEGGLLPLFISEIRDITVYIKLLTESAGLMRRQMMVWISHRSENRPLLSYRKDKEAALLPLSIRRRPRLPGLQAQAFRREWIGSYLLAREKGYYKMLPLI